MHKHNSKPVFSFVFEKQTLIQNTNAARYLQRTSWVGMNVKIYRITVYFSDYPAGHENLLILNSGTNINCILLLYRQY